MYWAVETRAQASLETTVELRIDGERPILGNEEIDYFIVSDNQRQVWFFEKDQVWSYSVDSLKFVRWPSITFDDFEIRGGFDTASDRFLFWNRGVGKVYTWSPGDRTPQRIDSSFHHRTQFDHSWFIHPKTSDIYAFGGYGFWQYRGFTTRFDQESSSWQIVPFNSTMRMPPPRSYNMHTFDPKRSQFHIFGGRTARNDAREDISVDHTWFSDYWVLDVGKKTWEERGIYGLNGMYDPNWKFMRAYEGKYVGVIDTLHNLAWYPIRHWEDPYDIRFMVYDLDRGFGAMIPVSLGNLGLDSFIYWFYLDATTNRLVIFWSKSVILYDDRSLRVSTLQLPPPDSTRALMDLVRKYGSVEAARAGSPSKSWYVLLVLLLVTGGSIVAYRMRPRQAPATTAVDQPNITFCYHGRPRLLLDGVPINLNLSEAEEALLFWLYWKQRTGEPYQVTDHIEELLWPQSPNIDYLRKQRNRVIQSLNQQLNQKLTPNILGREWLVDREASYDRRKREYALNLDGLLVTSDLELEEPGFIDASTLLLGCNGRWAQEIRSSYQQVVRTTA